MDVNAPLTHMTVFPEPGEEKAVAKLLLDLADHPGQVMTTLDPTIGFRIPAWLYETFVAIWDDQRVNLHEFAEDLKKSVTPEEVVELERFQASLKLSAAHLATAENPVVLPMPEASLALMQERMEEVFGAPGVELVQDPVKRKPGRPRKEVK